MLHSNTVRGKKRLRRKNIDVFKVIAEKVCPQKNANALKIDHVKNDVRTNLEKLRYYF